MIINNLLENEIIPCTQGQELHNISSFMNKSSSSLFSVPSTSKSISVSSSILDTSTPKITNNKYNSKSSSTGKKIYYNHFDRNYTANNTWALHPQCFINKMKLYGYVAACGTLSDGRSAFKYSVGGVYGG